MKISLLQAASLIAVLQSLLMAVISLQNKKGGHTGNIILASMLAIFSIVTGCSLFLSIDPIRFNAHYHKLLFMLGHLAFLVGPLLYFYVKSLLDYQFTLSKRDLYHALPFVIVIVCSLFIVLLTERLYLFRYPGRIYFSSAILIQSFIYIGASLRSLRSHGLSLGSFLSYIDDIKLSWVRFFMSGFVVAWLIHLQFFVGWDVLRRPQWCPYATSLYFLTAFLFFNGMVYLALRKPEIFHQNQKYRTSDLTENEKKEYREKLISLMRSEMLYLNPSLTLTEIAAKLNLPPRHVSQIINETLQFNFRDFVNKFRIEESKRLLAKPEQQLNIMGVALDAGFNSKSAFNSAFKRHTGVTPKEYKKQLLAPTVS